MLWLEKLGIIKTNWKNFKVEQQIMVLREDLSLVHLLILIKAMLKTVRSEGGGILVELY